MTRTKNSVVEPSRTPLQTRSSGLLDYIFPPARNRQGARKGPSKTASPPASKSAPLPLATAAGSSSQQLHRSCSSPTLGGCSTTCQQHPETGSSSELQPQISDILYHIHSIGDDDYDGLSDFLSEESEELQPAGRSAANIGTAANSKEATAEQRQQQQQHAPGDVAVPGAALPSTDVAHEAANMVNAEAEMVDIDGKAFILEKSQPIPAAAAPAAANPAAHAPDDHDGFTAVDKMLEQLSVDAMLHQQFAIEQQQRQLRQQQLAPARATETAPAVAGWHTAEQQHLVLGHSSSLPVYPTGPAAAATTSVLEAAAAATVHRYPAYMQPGHHVPSGPCVGPGQQQQQQQQHMLPAWNAPPPPNAVCSIPQAWQQQQQQQQAATSVHPPALATTVSSGLQGWQQPPPHGAQQQQPPHGAQQQQPPHGAQQQQPPHLCHSYSAPLVAQHQELGFDSAVTGGAQRPFSYQALLMADDIAGGVQQQQQQQCPTLQQPQQQQQQLPFGTHNDGAAVAAASRPPSGAWHQQLQPGPQQQQQQQQQQLGSWMQRPPLQSCHSAPVLTGQPQHTALHHAPYSAPNQLAMQQQRPQFTPSPALPVPHHPQQQQQQPGNLNPYQAELEALKAQLKAQAEEKQQRKERKQLRKMRKLAMLQQQQQNQHGGLAQQVLHAASATHTGNAAAAAASHMHWGGSAAAAAAPQAHAWAQRSHSLPQPQWQNPKTLDNNSNRPVVPSSSQQSARGFAAYNRRTNNPTDTAARQHAVAQSLRQLAFKTEQMHRPGAAAAGQGQHLHPAVAAAAADVATAGNSSRYSSFHHGRPPLPSPDGDAYGSRAAAGGRSAAPIVLNLQDDSPTPPPVVLPVGSSSSNANAAAGKQHEAHTAMQRMVTAAPAGTADPTGSGGSAGRWSVDHADGRSSSTLPAALDLRSAGSTSQHAFVDATATVQSEHQQAVLISDHRSLGLHDLKPAGAVQCAMSVGDASPGSTTSSMSRKRSWHSATVVAEDASQPPVSTAAAVPGGIAAPDMVLAAAGSASMLHSRHVHDSHHLAQQQQQQVSHQQQQYMLQAEGVHDMDLSDDILRQHTVQAGTTDARTGRSARSELADHLDSAAAASAQQPRQQRLLQLPFSRADVVERRPTITTESPVALPAAPPQAATQQQQHQLQLLHDLNSTSPAPGHHRKDPNAAAKQSTTSPTAAAAAAELASPGSSDVRTTSVEAAFKKPPARISKIPRIGSAADVNTSGSTGNEPTGLTSPGVASAAVHRQLSFGDAKAAAAGVAAAESVSSDVSGALGGPGVYRTSSGRTLRMLIHPVTGKVLPLGPAVEAKSSRLGNTSLGAPAPQLFGVDLQTPPLSNASITMRHSSVTAVLAGAANATAGAAAVGLGHNGSSSGGGEQLRRQGSLKHRRRSTETGTASHAAGHVGGQLAGMQQQQQWQQHGSPLLPGDSRMFQEQFLQVQMQTQHQFAAPVVDNAGAWGAMAVPNAWQQQQQQQQFAAPVAASYQDDGLMNVELMQQQEPMQSQPQPMEYDAARMDNGFTAAAAAAPGSESEALPRGGET